MIDESHDTSMYLDPMYSEDGFFGPDDIYVGGLDAP